VIEAMRADGVYVCPNCGAQSTLDGLIDGCEFCGTAFSVDAFNTKINSFCLKNDPMGNVFLTANRVKKLLPLFFLFIAGGFAINMFSEIMNPSTDSIVFSIIKSVFLGGITGGMAFILAYLLFSFIFLIFTLINLGRLGAQGFGKLSNKKSFQNIVRRYDPFFSESTFVANMENKVAAVMTAGSRTEVENILSVNGDELFNRYQNVIDCNLRLANFGGFTVDEHNQYLTLAMTFDIFRLDGEHIRKRTEKLIVTAAKDKRNITQQICDTKVFKCENCGAPISLLEGKKCKYCSQEFHLERYDWVITCFEVR
jgi:DNA-directed RNA polymerase subunit RPC12/RpoP